MHQSIKPLLYEVQQMKSYNNPSALSCNTYTSSANLMRIGF